MLVCPLCICTLYILRTSGKKSNERSGGVEFCGIMNAAIREDDPRDLVSHVCHVDIFNRMQIGLCPTAYSLQQIHLVMIARCINNRVVRRGADATSRKLDRLWAEKFPRDGIVYRGGAFNNDFQSFFALGKKYRVPGYLATSLRRKIAVAFALRAPETMARVLWRFQVDTRGITDPIYRCRHAFVLEKTHIPGEEEYLFVPYRSVLFLLSVYPCRSSIFSLTNARAESLALVCFELRTDFAFFQHFHCDGGKME